MQKIPNLPNLPSWVHVLLHYFSYLYQRAKHDRLPVNAGYMAYITLLSLVPLTTVTLTALSRVPMFDGVGDTVQQFVFSNFVPTAGEAIQHTLNEFIANTGKMTSIGLIFLFVAAVLLISAIDKNLNYIWRVRKKRRTVYSLSIYWMVLTLGPILMGTSLVFSSYIASLKVWSEDTVHLVYGLLPIIFSFIAFFGLYLLVPNIKVRFNHALAGALVAGCLFEVSKKLFAYYVSQFPSYQLIYGALAAVPLLFMWIYLCWMIVLIGAEITASLGEDEVWRVDKPFDMSSFLHYQNILMRKRIRRDSSDTESE
ncbi:virulence factor BrkB family protein [Vibrio sp. B1Z05]|uniref:virulence factor BrkB family protein n=1 Tax=Vibrio sp. B1Z05 TaxID=2654980 RepID=UPI00128E1D86|nr:virulence factor BrkB family protein [Vibrio sp. B1Z05]MPW37480.1 virulence factor BrkB family protein [Vibrio sp. B1Z05]